MVDRLTKSLRMLTPREEQQVNTLLRRLFAGETEGLDIRPLKGSPRVYRLRKGNIRIIFRQRPNGNIYILQVGRRSEKTYRKY